VVVRRRADAFADRLATGAHHGDPVLAHGLHGLAALTAASPPPALDPASRAAQRRHLVAVAAARPLAAPGRPDGSRRRGPAPRASAGRRAATALTALGATTLAVSGAGVATSRSVPGDALYGAKRAAERLQLDLAGSSVDRGLEHLRLARTRLGEVRTLLARGEGPPAPGTAVAMRVETALQAMDADTSTGAALITSAARAQREPAPLTELAGFATRQQAGLRAALPLLPRTAQAPAHVSLALLAEVHARAATLLAETPVVGPATSPADPGSAVSGPAASAPAGPAPVPSTPVPLPAAAPSSGPATAPSGEPASTSTAVPRPGDTGPASPAPSTAAPTPAPATSTQPLGGPPAGPPSPTPPAGASSTGSAPPSAGPAQATDPAGDPLVTGSSLFARRLQ